MRSSQSRCSETRRSRTGPGRSSSSAAAATKRQPPGRAEVFVHASQRSKRAESRGSPRGAARAGRIDLIGLGLLSLWLATLQIILDKGQEVEWFGAVWLRWFTGISIVSMICFIAWQLWTPSPIVNLRILKNRNFAVGCGLFACFGAVLYSMITLQPLFLQTLLGYTALDAGLTVSPRGLGALAALFLVGLLIRRVSPRFLAGFGFLVFGISTILFSRFTLEVAMSNIVPPNIVNGFGLGFIFVPLTTMALGTLPNDQLGNATGIQNLLRNIGGSIGISFVTTMLARYAQAHQVFLVPHVSELNPIFQQRLGALQGVFESNFSPPDALIRAQASINNTVVQQVNYWAFVQLFYLIAWVCLICILGMLLFRRVKTAGPVAA